MMRRLTLAALLPFNAIGQTAQSTYNSHGPAADKIANLSWLMTIVFLLVTVIMSVLIAWAAKRRRGTLAEHAPVDAGGGQKWIAVGGLAIPLAILTVIFVLGLNLLAQFPIHGPQHHAMKSDILIVGHQWWWEVHYLNDQTGLEVTTANEIHIPVNRPMNIELESADVMHSFWIPALHGKVDLIPGHPNYVRIEASETGNFAGECAEYCGAEHARMRLLVVAQQPDEYAAWLEQQRKPAAEPASAAAMAGEQDFLAGACIMCHQIRGTVSGGRVAPDLTHIASRQFIAANSYPNDDAHLEAWITHAQSLKPEAEMPDLTQFSGEQLRDIVAYLRQLK
jgi:cytochrome c oxidase subunit 2